MFSINYLLFWGNTLKLPTDITLISMTQIESYTFISRSNWQKIAYAVAVVFSPPSKKKGIAIMVCLIELLPGVGPALNRREEHFFFSFHEIGHI